MSPCTRADLVRKTAQRRNRAVSGLTFLACSGVGALPVIVFASPFYPTPFGALFSPETAVLAYFTANRVKARAMSLVFAVVALTFPIFVACSAELFADTLLARRAGVAGLALGAETPASGFWLLTPLLLWALRQPEATDELACCARCTISSTSQPRHRTARKRSARFPLHLRAVA